MFLSGVYIHRCSIWSSWSWLHDSFDSGEYDLVLLNFILLPDPEYEKLDTGCKVDVVFTFFEKAIHKLDHGVLASKRSSNGICDKSLKTLGS